MTLYQFKNTITTILLLLSPSVTTAAQDMLPAAPSLMDTEGTAPRKKNVFKRFAEAFSAIDTAYVMHNRYNMSFMLQNTNTFESYRMRASEEDQNIHFSSTPAVKFGPYIDWRWLSVGYTFEAFSLGNRKKTKKTEFAMSLYSAMLGCDLIFRRTGENFMLRNATGFGEGAEKMKDEHFGGITSKVTGINAYYIFNHRRFSYPAAFSQSNIQRKSCGTWKLGMAFTIHEMDFDYNMLPDEVSKNPETPISSDLQVDYLKYSDFNISAGYAYNWVFKKNWLMCLSLTPAIGYKHVHYDSSEWTANEKKPHALHRENFNLDITTRAGLVWHNGHYFWGLSFVMHNYNFHRNRLSIHHTFGTLSTYLGFHFFKRKTFRK